MDTLQRYGPLAGRILIAVIFIFSGFSKLAGFDGAAGYIASKGLPLPQLGAIIAIVVELGGGILLAIGWKTRWVAAALALFTLAAGFLFHNFWAVPVEQMQMQRTQFLKNLAMVGGLIYVVVYGSGPVSVDQRTPARL